MSMYPDEQVVVINGEQVLYPGLIGGKFSSGDFADPAKRPSFITAETINLVLDNLAALIIAAGGVAKNTGENQLVSAMASVASAKKIVQRDDAGRAQFGSPVAGADAATKAYVDSELLKRVFPIGSVYFQGPHDISPGTLFPGTTWSNVTSEEANLVRRCSGNLAGEFFAGVPAALAISVASGVPTISIVSGGSGYLGGGNGNLSLSIVGLCTTQMVANAIITSGVITSINVITAGAGYTSGKVAVYDGIVGHGDLTQGHWHDSWAREILAPYGSGALCGVLLNDAQGANMNYSSDNYVRGLLPDPINGIPRVGPETSSAWIAIKKWRRTV